jgi:hypothetical protein
MICPYCGQENSDKLEVCGFCGGSLFPATEQPIIEASSLETPADETQPAELPNDEISTAETPVEASPRVPDLKEPDLTTIQPAKPPSGRLYGSKVWWIAGCAVFVCLVLACIAAVIGIYRYTKLFSFINPASETLVPQFTQITVDTPISVLIPIGTNIPAESPAITPQLTPKILFFDDFSDPTSGWDQVDETDYTTNYYDGAYRIKIDTEMSDSWANPGVREFTDVIVEVTATKNSGPEDNDFGLICRYQDTNHFYYGVISSDGYYGILKVTSESTDILGHDNLVYSDLIKQGSVTNTLRFECVGNELTLFTNEQLLDKQIDSEYSTGNVGLIAGTYNTPGADILFDNFTVYSP